MLIAVQPGKITFGEMQFISARFPVGTVQPKLVDEMMDELFDDVSSEIACLFGFEGVETVTTLLV